MYAPFRSTFAHMFFSDLKFNVDYALLGRSADLTSEILACSLYNPLDVDTRSSWI